MRALLLTSLVAAGAMAEPLSAPPLPPLSPLLIPPPMPSLQPLDAPLRDRGGRVRWGISPSIGVLAPYSTFSFAGELRLGYQLTRRFSMFFTGGAHLAVGSGRVFPFAFVGAIAEAMPNDFFYLGAGPVIAFGRLTVGQLEPSSNQLELFSVQEPDVVTPFKAGLDFRLGLHFGSGRPPTFRRGGFSLGVHALLLLHPDMRLGWTQNNRGVVARTTETVATITPMLTLGYDAR